MIKRSYTALLKESVVLECAIQSTPIRSYAWQKDGYDIAPSKRFTQNVEVIDETHMNTTLTISNIKETDAGNYICVVINPAGIARDNISLEGQC